MTPASPSAPPSSGLRRSARRQPPRKLAGHATGPRRIAGELLDVRGCAELLGVSQAMVRARVERRLLPYRKWGGRIILVKAELLRFLAGLDGVGADEAVANVRARARGGA